MGYLDDAADAVFAASEVVKEAFPMLAEALETSIHLTDSVYAAENKISAGTEMACTSGADPTQWRRRQSELQQLVEQVVQNRVAIEKTIENMQRLTGAYAGMLNTDAGVIRLTGGT